MEGSGVEAASIPQGLPLTTMGAGAEIFSWRGLPEARGLVLHFTEEKQRSEELKVLGSGILAARCPNSSSG